MAAPADAVEVIAADLRTVAVELHANLVAAPASRAAALLREERERRRGDGRRLHRVSATG